MQNQILTYVLVAVANLIFSTGDLKMTTKSIADPGWLIANGSCQSQTQYSDLFALIAYAYGNDCQTGYFRLPDLSGRVPIGAGQTVGSNNGNSFRELGQKIGEENHTLTIDEIASHSHSYYDPGHTHQYIITAQVGGFCTYNSSGSVGTTWTTTPNSVTNISINSSGGGQAHNNMQPSTVINFMIKY